MHTYVPNPTVRLSHFRKRKTTTEYHPWFSATILAIELLPLYGPSKERLNPLSIIFTCRNTSQTSKPRYLPHKHQTPNRANATARRQGSCLPTSLSFVS